MTGKPEVALTAPLRTELGADVVEAHASELLATKMRNSILMQTRLQATHICIFLLLLVAYAATTALLWQVLQGPSPVSTSENFDAGHLDELLLSRQSMHTASTLRLSLTLSPEAASFTGLLLLRTVNLEILSRPVPDYLDRPSAPAPTGTPGAAGGLLETWIMGSTMLWRALRGRIAYASELIAPTVEAAASGGESRHRMLT